MKSLILSLFLAIAAAIPASAQRLNLDFPGLADKADEVVDVTLDAEMLRLASKFLSAGDGDEKAVRDMIRGLEGIYVRSYEFSKEGEYDRSLVDQIPREFTVVNIVGRIDIERLADLEGEFGIPRITTKEKGRE
jgi:hypothetical protein